MASEMTIVGIGASAGGVEALQTLFGHVPVDSGMAFVVITPLARGPASSLVEILARATSLPVIEAQDGAEVQSDHVYVIPPDGIVTIVDHRLQVRQPDQQQLIRHPINILLASLAEHSSERAVAIILSGSDNDMLVEAERSQKVASLGLTLACGSRPRSPSSVRRRCARAISMPYCSKPRYLWLRAWRSSGPRCSSLRRKRIICSCGPASAGPLAWSARLRSGPIANRPPAMPC